MFCSKLAYMFWEDNESLRSHVGNYYTRTCKVVGEFSAPCLIMMVDGRFPHGGLADRLHGCINKYEH